LCRRFDISAPAAYKWLGRHRAGKGLEDLSRRPANSPGKTPAAMEDKIVEARRKHPAWGGRKLKRWLENRGEAGVPSAGTITAVLRRHGLLSKPAGPSGSGWQRFERDEPNQLWQIDFKGWFTVSGGGRCHPLTMLDDHSRYNLLLEPCRGENFVEVRPLLERAFATYGLPSALLCDHGPPWGDALGAVTVFEAWLLRLGIDVYHGRPRHPQTQGKEERFHRTLKAELLSRTTEWRDLDHCRKCFAEWREIYNRERPHEALGGEVPAGRYRASPRPMPARLPEAGGWYGGDDVVRKVKSKGEITFNNVFWMIGRAFVGQEVALRPVGEDRWDAYYCWKKIGTADFGKRRGKEKFRYEPLSGRRGKADKGETGEAGGDAGSVNDVPEQL
jgi:transposase InsO family protein